MDYFLDHELFVVNAEALQQARLQTFLDALDVVSIRMWPLY